MFDPIQMALCSGGSSGGGIPVVDMSDVLMQDEGAATINLLPEHCERIGLDDKPKLIWMSFFGGLKTMVLCTPQLEVDAEAEEWVAYGGTAVIEGSVVTVWLALSPEGGTGFMGVPA